MFLALFAAAASAFLAYIYVATAGEVTRRADAAITREMQSLEAVYRRGGFPALNQAVIERASSDHGFLYLLMNKDGAPISGSIGASPMKLGGDRDWASFRLTETDQDGAVVKRPARGLEERMSGGEIVFVGADVGEAESYVVKILRALWGAGALVILLGLGGGVLVSRDVSRNISGLSGAIEAVRGGNLRARVPIRGTRDEYDELAAGLNDMLDRLERSIGGLRHAGDAIAHDLRSPLTRLRARLEAAMIEVDAGAGDPKQALHQALDDADGVLKTFNAVLAIARLEAAGEPTNTISPPLIRSSRPRAGRLTTAPSWSVSVSLKGNREFIAQALANILDNAVKYTPQGGAVMLRVRRRTSGDIEMTVTDTGPGVPDTDRARVVQRFVRLENSRNEPGVGLGLSLVAAVAQAHRGHLELDDGPGAVDGFGPGLRVALVLPKLG